MTRPRQCGVGRRRAWRARPLNEAVRFRRAPPRAAVGADEQAVGADEQGLWLLVGPLTACKQRRGEPTASA